MLWILITSGAQGKLPSLGLDYGVGKSTKGLQLLNSSVYAGNWEKTKASSIRAYWHIDRILEEKHLGCYWDDMQLTVGKDKQHSPEIRELAYYLTTVRPYTHVWICSAPHRGMIQKDFRDMFHFEIICPTRGRYEVQQLRRWIDFDHPIETNDRLQYRGEGFFLKLSPDIQDWYDKWRDESDKEIRARLKSFRGQLAIALDLNLLNPAERGLMEEIKSKVYIRYETLHSRGLSDLAMRLKRKGWLEMDRGRRYQLTLDAEKVMLHD